MLHIAHVSHQGFHSHRRSKSIYLKCLMEWNLLMFRLFPQTVQLQYYYWINPIPLFQNYDLTFRKWFARSQVVCTIHHPRVATSWSQAQYWLISNSIPVSTVVENCAGNEIWTTLHGTSELLNEIPTRATFIYQGSLSTESKLCPVTRGFGWSLVSWGMIFDFGN